MSVFIKQWQQRKIVITHNSKPRDFNRNKKIAEENALEQTQYIIHWKDHYVTKIGIGLETVYFLPAVSLMKKYSKIRESEKNVGFLLKKSQNF